MFSDRRKIDQKTSRAINRRLILNLIRRNGAMSRTDLSMMTGLSPATVGFVVGSLIDEGFLVSREAQGKGNGRRPVPVALNVDGNLAIGVQTRLGRIECILADFEINVIDRQSATLEDHAPETLVAAAGKAIRELLRARRPDQRVLGVGLTVPGRLDTANGLCLGSHRFGWKTEVPIARMMSEEVGFHVYLEDDTLAFALAHHMFGLGQNCENFGALAVGDGIGYGVVMDAKVRHGALGNAGKVGHVMHDETGPPCECGRHGCLQAFYSFSALSDRWAATGSDVQLVEAVNRKDPAAVAMVSEAGGAIGRHLGEWVTVTDPEMIVLGAEAVALGDAFIGSLEDALAHAYYRKPIPPIRADDSSYYWTAGAAAVVIQQVFDFEAAPAYSTSIPVDFV